MSADERKREVECRPGHASVRARGGGWHFYAGGGLASLFLILRLPDFIVRYPEIQVELGVSDRPVDLVGENIDCVIRGGPLTEQSLVARHVGDFPFVTCATPAYLARHGTPTHPSDFESQ